MPSPITSQAGARRGFAGRRRAGPAGPLLLLLGTPGAGKRPLGSYLAEEHGFVHLDFEDAATREAFLGSSDEELRVRLASLRAAGRGLAITWGAGPEPAAQLEQVRRLRLLGVEPVWFDSDRGAACRAHYAAAPRPPRFRFVDPFEADGRFRALEAVAGELARPRRRRSARSIADALPRRRGPAVPQLLRGAQARSRRLSPGRIAGWPAAYAAGGLALAAATAFGTVALLAGVGGGAPNRQLAIAKRQAAAARAPGLPQRGVLVSGRSLAGVRLGDSMARVRALWGTHFRRCGECKPVLWLYLYPPPDDPVGAGVQFAHGRVVAVFTLGGPAGWHTDTGLRVGQVLDNPTVSDDGSTWLTCTGYGARSTRSGGDAVTSILTQGSSVYGFELTRPSVSPCQ